MELGALNRLLREGPMISGVSFSIDPLEKNRLFAALKATPSASFISLQQVAMQRFRATLAQNITVQITIFVAFAGTIAFGVVYNLARISLSEQGREMASLRVLGFTKREVSALLLTELAVIVLLAQPVGWLIGFALAILMDKGFSTELYRVPFIVGSEVYAYSSIVVIAAAVASGLIVRRRIDRLDMIAVLKTRE
jgi:putative ABC transport system permease protein